MAIYEGRKLLAHIFNMINVKIHSDSIGKDSLCLYVF